MQDGDGNDMDAIDPTCGTEGLSTANSDKNSERRRGRPENLKPWPKGVSGNICGRPKKRLIDQVLQERLEDCDSQEAVAIAQGLIEQAKKGDVRAAQLIAERTQGKPRSPIEVSGPDGDTLQVAVVERLLAARRRTDDSPDQLLNASDKLEEAQVNSEE